MDVYYLYSSIFVFLLKRNDKKTENSIKIYATLVINQFKKIHWVTLSRTLNGNELFAEVEAVDWNYIQNIVKEMNGGIELIPIKKFISDILNRLSKSAETERKKNYLEERLV